MDRQYPITLVVRTIHLDIVVAPLFNEFDSHRRLHKPRKHRVNQEYHLHISDNGTVSPQFDLRDIGCAYRESNASGDG